MSHETILKMIEEADPGDTAKLEEMRFLDFLGFPGYAISPLGEIISHKRKGGPYKMAIGTNGQGYKAVNLQHEGGDSHRKTIHRLVAHAYIPNPEMLHAGFILL